MRRHVILVFLALLFFSSATTVCAQTVPPTPSQPAISPTSVNSDKPAKGPKNQDQPAPKDSASAAAAPTEPPSARETLPAPPPRAPQVAPEPGQIVIELRYLVDGVQLQGNRDRSFLNEGINHTAEISFFNNVPVWGTRRMESLIVGRYTDNPRVDPERNSLQRAYFRLIGPSFEATLGDSLVNYSRLTLNQNIKGLHAWKNLPWNLRATGTVGFFTDRWGSLYRDFSVFRNIALDCSAASLPGMPAPGCIEDPPNSGQFRLSPVNPGKPYSRLVGGARLERKAGQNGWIAFNWSHGEDQRQSLPEALLVCENTVTAERTVRELGVGCATGEAEVPAGRRPSPEAINNDVIGVDTFLEYRPAKLRFRGELAGSWTAGGIPPAGASPTNFLCASQPPIVGASVLDSRCFPQQSADFAGRFEITQTVRKLNWRVDYARFQPDFFSANARQIRDLQDFSVRGDYEIVKWMSIAASWRRSNDNLNGQRNFTSIVRAPEVRLVFRDVPVFRYRRASLEVGYRERNLDTSGNPMPNELRRRSTGIPFFGISLPWGPAQFTFDYEHRHDSDSVRAPLSSDTDRYAFSYRGNHSWGEWDISPFFRFELERLDKNTPTNPALSPTDPVLIFPADFLQAFDTNRSIQAGFLLEAPRYFRFEGQYREFNSLALSSLRASALLDPQMATFYANQGFKRPSWRAAATFKIGNDEDRTVTAFYERTNNFFATGDPFVPDQKSFRETVIGGAILLRFKR